jgi:hypothetical protein
MNWWITLFLGLFIAYLILKFTFPLKSNYKFDLAQLRPDDFDLNPPPPSPPGTMSMSSPPSAPITSPSS